jgi:bifunctional UDP-N-acetylglucosamine pyrophosphorylase / glucosamine-1-phosphate N-acetyltransferase
MTLPLQAVVLAAGKSSRFRTSTTKLIFSICGQELVVYPLAVLTTFSMPICVVVGYQQERVRASIAKARFPSISFVEQQEPRGTGHALLCTKSHWSRDHILVINGDMPLITKDIIQNLINTHITSHATITFVVAKASDITQGYGRVIRENATIKEIREAKELLPDDSHRYPDLNAGIYLFERTFLEEHLDKLSSHTIAHEIYITDLIKRASDQGKRLQTIEAPFTTIQGINTLKELHAVEQSKRTELIISWMERGVYFAAPDHTYIDINVSIGPGTSIGAGVHLLNGTSLGSNCHIGPFAIIDNSILHDHVTVLPHCVINDAELHTQATIGPFAHLRNKTSIGTQSTIGNFVEVTKSTIGTQSKAKHLSYLGNAEIGSHVNIGAGTITCNYDGFAKHTTTIHNNAHIGSNNSLVAPVTIGQDALTAAGSVITENVPEEALAIARTRQVNKEGYVQRKKQRIAALMSAKVASL